MNHKLLTSGVIAAAVLGSLGLWQLTASDKATAQAGAPVDAADMAYIAEDGPIARADLHRAIDRMFSEAEFSETRAMVVMVDGEVIAERYAPGYDRDTRFISWSMAKSVTALLIGILVSDGRLALDEPAPVPEWRQMGDPRGAITLRQLLHMASGLNHTEAGSPPYESDEVRMLFLDGRDDMAAYAEGQPLEAEPGSQFEYSTNTTVILSAILARTLTDSSDPDERRAAVMDFANGRLFGPLGLTSMTPEFDASGTMIGGSIMQASARDWARIGEFLRNGGRVGEVPVVPEPWIDFMLTPSEQDPAYGGHIWLNRVRPEGRNTVLFPNAGPDSVFALLGHLGQQVVVSPEQNLVLVRLGKTQDDVGRPIHEQMGRIAALFPP